MIDREHIKTVFSEFQDGHVTNYVFERELMNYFEMNTRVKLSDSLKHNNQESYCIMLVPEKASDRLIMNVILDKNTILNVYNSEEFSRVVERLKREIPMALSKYNKYMLDHKSGLSCYNMIGFMISLYTDYKKSLKSENNNLVDDVLPKDEDLFKYADMFSTETATNVDFEDVLGKNVISSDVVQIIKQTIQNFGATTGVKFIDDGKEHPTENFYYQDRMQYCNSTLGTVNHKDIPYDFLPKTNQ